MFLGFSLEIDYMGHGIESELRVIFNAVETVLKPGAGSVFYVIKF